MVVPPENGPRIRYLRLSVTRRCDLRCVYCRPRGCRTETGLPVLAPAEIEGFVRHLVSRHGLRKVRITGGEPALRDDLEEIIGRLADIEGVRDLAMTTNGMALRTLAPRLAAAGLSRVNVSLDTLDPDRFARIAGAPGLDRVLEGIAAAQEAGLTPLRLNTVVVRGENDDELPGLVRFAAGIGAEIRFIELMPMGPLADRWRRRYVPAEEMRSRLSGVVRSWHPISARSDSAMRHSVRLDDGRLAWVGLISPMSHPFCRCCDRIRIAADGTFFPCLMDDPHGSVLPALRPALDPDGIDKVLSAGLHRKAPEHPACGRGLMTHIGG